MLFSKLRNKFEMVKLSDVSESIFSGITPKSGGDAYCDDGISFIRSGEILENGSIDPNIELKIKPEIHNGIMKSSKICLNDVLIAIVGATIGKVGLYSCAEEANINQAIAGVRLRQGIIEPKFLLYYLMSKTGQTFLEYLKRPVARANINLEEIGSIEIPKLLPAQQIAFCDLFENGINRHNAKITQADNLLSGMDGFVNELLGYVGGKHRSELSWAVRYKDVLGKRLDANSYKPTVSHDFTADVLLLPLKDVANINGNERIKPEKTDDLVPYIGLPECSLTSVETVSYRPYSDVQGRNVVTPGDILFARIEPSVSNKKYVYAETLLGNEYAYVSTEFYTVRADGSPVLQQYLYTMLFSSYVYSQISGKTTGSSGRRRIDKSMFENVLIPVPDKAIQQKIADEAVRRRTLARQLREDATREWQEAKALFEKEILGEV